MRGSAGEHQYVHLQILDWRDLRALGLISESCLSPHHHHPSRTQKKKKIMHKALASVERLSAQGHARPSEQVL